MYLKKSWYAAADGHFILTFFIINLSFSHYIYFISLLESKRDPLPFGASFLRRCNCIFSHYLQDQYECVHNEDGSVRAPPLEQEFMDGYTAMMTAGTQVTRYSSSNKTAVVSLKMCG